MKHETKAYGKVEKFRKKQRYFPTFPQALLIVFLIISTTDALAGVVSLKKFGGRS